MSLGRIVVPSAVVQQAGAVVLTPRELERVGRGRAGGLRRPVGIVAVVRLHGSRGRHRQRRAKSVDEVGGAGAGEALVVARCGWRGG